MQERREFAERTKETVAIEREGQARADANHLAEVGPHVAQELGDSREAPGTIVIALLATLILTATVFITSKTAQSLGIDIAVPIATNTLHFILSTLVLLFGATFLVADVWKSTEYRMFSAVLLACAAAVIAYIYSISVTFFGAGESLYLAADVIVVGALLERTLEQWLIWHITTVNSANLQARREQGDRIAGAATAESQQKANWYREVTYMPNTSMLGTGVKVSKAGKTSYGGRGPLYHRSQATHLPSQRFAMAASSYLIPLTLTIATTSFLVWRYVAAESLLFAVLAAVATIAIASPGTLALIAVYVFPVSVGRAAEQGIAIREPAIMQELAKTDIVLFGKTGLLTAGMPKVTDIIRVGKLTDLGMMRLAAGVERNVDSAIARAIVEATEVRVGLGVPLSDDVKVIPGYGVEGEVETCPVIVGNRRLMLDRGVDIKPGLEIAREIAEQEKTAVYVAVDGRLEGVIGIRDNIRPDAKAEIERLRRKGIRPALLTGDAIEYARSIAEEFGIDKVYAEMPPSAKAGIIKYLQEKGQTTVFVGTGKDDIPALRQADVGIEVTSARIWGLRSLDAELEAKDVVLRDQDLRGVVNTIALSSMTLRELKLGVIWGVAYNTIAIPLAAGVLYLANGIVLRAELAAILSLITTAVTAIGIVGLGRRIRKIV